MRRFFTLLSLKFFFPCVILTSLLTTHASQSANAGIITDVLARSGRAIAKRTEVKDGRRYVKVNPSVEDLNLKQLGDRLKQFGIVLPVSLEGEVSAQVAIEVPIGSPRDAKLYRLQGTVESNRLILDGFEIRKLVGNLNYRDGIAKLDQLTFLIPHEHGPGRVSGNASLNLLPVEDLCGTLSIDSLPLSSMKELLTDIPDIDGRMTGRLEFCVEDAEIRKVDAWSASGKIKAEPLVVRPLSLDRVNANLELAKGILQANEIVAEGYSAAMQGNAILELKAPFNVTGDATVRSANLQISLEELDPEIARLVEKGQASAEMEFEGAIDPLKYESKGSVQAEKLSLVGRSVERIQTELFLDQRVIRLQKLQAKAFGGNLQGSALLNHQTLEIKAQAEFQELEIGEFLPAEITDLWQVAGEADGSASLAVPAGSFQKPDEWSGSANLDLEKIAFAGTTEGQLAATMTLAKGALQLETLKGRVAGLNTEASGHISMTQPFEFSAGLDAQTPEASEQTALLPFGIRGRAELHAEAKGQWQPRKFQIDGQMTADDMIWNDFVLEHFQTKGRITQEVLSIRSLEANLYGGGLRGSLELPISPPQPPNQGAVGKAEITWDGVDLAETLNGQGIDAVWPGAEFSGTLAASVPAGTWRTPQKWTASADVELAKLKLQNGTTTDGRAKVRYGNSLIRLREFQLTAGQQSLSGTGHIGIFSPYRWQTSATAQNLEIGTVLPFFSLPELADLSGIVSATGDFQGSLASIRLTGQGRVNAEALKFGAVEAEKVKFDVTSNEQTVAIKNAEAEILEGVLNGSAQWPWKPEKEITLKADWTDLSFGPLFEQFATAVPESLSPVSGQTTGTMKVRLPRDRMQEPFTWSGDLEAKVADLALSHRDIGSFTANAAIDDQAIDYLLDGELFSGSVEAKGDWSVTRNINRGTLNAEKISLADLTPLLDFEILNPLRGKANLEAQYRHGGPFLLEQASGSLSVTQPRWNEILISESLAGSMTWNENRLTIENLSGTFARGQLRANLAASVGSGRSGSYSLVLQQADLQNFVSNWTGSQQEVTAGIDFRLQGTLGEELRGSGTLAARRVRYRLPLNRRVVDLGSWRVPVRVNYSRQRLQIDSFRATGTPFNSRTTADVSLTIDRGVRFKGEATYNRADLPQLLNGLGRTGQAGRGFLSGTMSFSGRNFKSLDDLEMTVDSRLRQTQAATVPLLRNLQPFLSASLPLTEIFQTGQLRGRLKDSVFRVERLSLNGQHANLYSLGTVTLAGRLNLDVTADTGRLTEDRLLSRAIVSRLLTVASPPVAILVRANQFLADRVVHLTATGTLRNPRVQVRPVESLSEEAIRFFLIQAVE